MVHNRVLPIGVDRVGVEFWYRPFCLSHINTCSHILCQPLPVLSYQTGGRPVVGLCVEDAKSPFIRKVVPAFRDASNPHARLLYPSTFFARPDTTSRPTGLAFSGGGIRSASFCLGVLLQFTSVSHTPLVC
jgi:hypothetical protein